MAKGNSKDRVSQKESSRIPHFDSAEEEAEFWDTHDITEFADELEEAGDIRFAKPGTRRSVTITLSEDEYVALATRAAAEGKSLPGLVKSWALARLGDAADARTAGGVRTGVRRAS